MASPNVVKVAWSILRSLQTVDAPRPGGSAAVDHALLGDGLARLKAQGISALPVIAPTLTAYLEKVGTVDPDSLTPDEAKALWINIYNAGALKLARRALEAGRDSVLRVPGGFRDSFIVIAGVALSLDDIEHAKLRRLGDPRVHGALVCGSVSCPTLRRAPYEGQDLDEALDSQMRFFLAQGGAVPDPTSGTIHLSRVFSWFGSDFVRPARMPTFVPSRSRSVLRAIRPWLDGDAAAMADRGARVQFQAYDWGLRCAVV